MAPPGPPNIYQTAPVRLRQIALAARDLDTLERTILQVLQTSKISSDPAVSQWGLRNTLLSLGGEVLEIVAPTKPDTSAGRFLDRQAKGKGVDAAGYMLIMQCKDADRRLRYIEERKLGKVVFNMDNEGYKCRQYHPRIVPGGVMPELDSQSSVDGCPDPLRASFGPWEPAGSLAEWPQYSAVMERNADLKLVGATLRLKMGDVDVEGAARKWEEVFGIARSRDLLQFTNAKVGFVRDVDGKGEGLESITIAVKGRKRFEGILQRAKEMGLCGDGWINLGGIRWFFVYDGEPKSSSRL